MKRKVISFFVLLILFAGIMASIAVLRYGSILGFVTFSNPVNYRTTSEPINQNFLVFWLSFFVFILVLAFVFNHFKKHREKDFLSDYNSESHPFKRKIINFDLGG